jgi:hypothetical protein
MVDPIITYVFALFCFVALLGPMLYLTFMTEPTDDESELGKSVVGGAGAQQRSDDVETGELAATTESEAVTEERDEEMYDPEDAADGEESDAAEGADGTADEGDAADAADADESDDSDEGEA